MYALENATHKQLFLLFNCTLLLTFPFQSNAPILQHFFPISQHPLFWHGMACWLYGFYFLISFSLSKTRLRTMIQFLSLCLAIFHFIQI